MSLAAHAKTQPEPRIRPLKAPAKKSAAKKPAAKTSAAKSSRPTPKKVVATKAKPAAGKAKPAAAKAKPAASKAKPAAKAKAPARAKPASKVKPGTKARTEVKRFRPAPRDKERDKDLPAPKPMPEIPVELLSEGPKVKKPRKPRGKKAEAVKPVGALDLILAQLDDAKAEQIVSIPLDDKRAVADAVVVASGRSNRHVGAIADQLVQKLKEKGHRDIRVQGMPQCDWVLVDIGDVIVHIFRPEVRSFYNLEKLLSASAPDDWAAV